MGEREQAEEAHEADAHHGDGAGWRELGSANQRRRVPAVRIVCHFFPPAQRDLPASQAIYKGKGINKAFGAPASTLPTMAWYIEGGWSRPTSRASSARAREMLVAHHPVGLCRASRCLCSRRAGLLGGKQGQGKLWAISTTMPELAWNAVAVLAL